MTKLSLSIVIPVYNEELHLKACLKAIAAQTQAPDEVIVVDNNSTDGSIKIAQKYSWVSVVKESEQGVLAARNRGFNTAKSDLIGRIDADTILPPGWCQEARAIMSNQRFAAVTGPVSYYDMPMPETNYWIDHQIRKYLYKGAPHIPFLFGSNCVIRRSAWQQVKSSLCNKRTIHEDLDLAIHLTLSKLSILYDKRLLAKTSSRRYDDSFKAFRHYMKMYVQTYREHGFSLRVPKLAVSFYWIGYITLKPVRRMHDDKTGKKHLRKIVKGTPPRKNPMSS